MNATGQNSRLRVVAEARRQRFRHASGLLARIYSPENFSKVGLIQHLHERPLRSARLLFARPTVK